MRDRFSDLQAGQDASKFQKKKKEKDLEKGGEVDFKGESEALVGFFEEIGQLRDAIGVMKQDIDQIESIHQKALNTISEQEARQKTEELERLMDSANKGTRNIRNRLKVMDTQNKEYAKAPKHADDARIRITQHGTLTKRFVEVLVEYKEIQKKYEDKYKQRMQRQILIVKPDATPTELKGMIDGGGKVFASSIMSEGQSKQRAEAKRALQDIEERHEEIRRIEKSVIELQQLFMDMSVMVQAQGELLNQIEVHVSNAVESTETGVQELSKAVVIQKANRKKMLIIVGLILLVCVGVGVAVSFLAH